MTSLELKMIAKLGLKESDFKPKDKTADIEDAILELAEMLAAQDDAIVELAEIIGGNE